MCISLARALIDWEMMWLTSLIIGASLVSSRRSAVSSISLRISLPFSCISWTSCSAESRRRLYCRLMAEIIDSRPASTSLKSVNSINRTRSSRAWKLSGSLMAMTWPAAATWWSASALLGGANPQLAAVTGFWYCRGTIKNFFKNWIGIFSVKSDSILSNGRVGQKGRSYWLPRASISCDSEILSCWTRISPMLPPFSSLRR